MKNLFNFNKENIFIVVNLIIDGPLKKMLS